MEDEEFDVSDSDPSKPTVYLVEDNSDFRFYLRDNLKQLYNVHESANGKDAWKGIVKVVPDIVISDVMMPVMDGLELCRKIKNDPRTAHIPVILLTAQSIRSSPDRGGWMQELSNTSRNLSILRSSSATSKAR